jgi:Flp pilus assembly protein TadG
MKTTLTKRIRGERGSAILEVALTLPLMLMVSVGIFEFGRAYQTWQVLTNAAREGARIAVLPGATAAGVQTRVREYVASGQLSNPNTANAVVTPVNVSIGGGNTATGSQVVVTYPFNFIVLNPVVRLVAGGSTVGGAPITMTVNATMRNEQ